MKTESNYNLALSVVCAVCDISQEELFNGHSELCVDARMLLVGWMSGYGYTEATLARLTGWSQQRINYLKNHAAERLIRRVFRDKYDDMSRQIATLIG